MFSFYICDLFHTLFRISIILLEDCIFSTTNFVDICEFMKAFHINIWFHSYPSQDFDSYYQTNCTFNCLIISQVFCFVFQNQICMFTCPLRIWYFSLTKWFFGNFVADFKFMKSISGVGSSSSQGMMAVGCGYGSVAMEKSFRVIYINMYIFVV